MIDWSAAYTRHVATFAVADNCWDKSKPSGKQGAAQGE